MTTDSSHPLDEIDPESIAPEDIDETEVHTALSSSDPMVRQRGIAVCETLAGDGIDTVRLFLDDVATLAGDSNTVVSLRAISVLDSVAEMDLAALEGRLSDLVGVLDADVVDVQLTGATILGKLVVERSDLLEPYTKQLIEAIHITELDQEIEDVSDVVDDRVTRQTLQEHVMGERSRRMASRRTLINVVVALIEEEPRSAFDAVDSLVTLLDDVDPAVIGGAVNALGELAAVNPDVVAPASDHLIDCLDHDRTAVRVRSIWALGHLGDDAVVPKLRTIAATDDDEDVREIAEKTANFLT
ncbi:HEAT repeat domain-containing protein [Halocatena marina]|uniref:HEAT repeat domain-containing protein n=1 Tax=Halocatena marina TaxID=2934937 RepID=UPI0022240133|nr:HEAT repeat domain-containing protein [Halocatena marina]